MGQQFFALRNIEGQSAESGVSVRRRWFAAGGLQADDEVLNY